MSNQCFIGMCLQHAVFVQQVHALLLIECLLPHSLDRMTLLLVDSVVPLLILLLILIPTAGWYYWSFLILFSWWTFMSAIRLTPCTLLSPSTWWLESKPLCYLGAHAKLQNPTTTPSGRISNEPEVATYIYASSQEQRMHSARTNCLSARLGYNSVWATLGLSILFFSLSDSFSIIMPSGTLLAFIGCCCCCCCVLPGAWARLSSPGTPSP